MPTKPANPSTSDVKQRHKRKGKRSPLHSSRGRIGTATLKKNVDAAARRANKRSEKAMRPDNNILTKLGNYITGTGGVNSLAKKQLKRLLFLNLNVNLLFLKYQRLNQRLDQ